MLEKKRDYFKSVFLFMVNHRFTSKTTTGFFLYFVSVSVIISYLIKLSHLTSDFRSSTARFFFQFFLEIFCDGQLPLNFELFDGVLPKLLAPGARVGGQDGPHVGWKRVAWDPTGQKTSNLVLEQKTGENLNTLV